LESAPIVTPAFNVLAFLSLLSVLDFTAGRFFPFPPYLFLGMKMGYGVSALGLVTLIESEALALGLVT